MAIGAFIRNRVLGQAVGFAVGAAAAQSFEPPLRELAYELEKRFTNRVHSPDALADMVVRGIRGQDNAANEAANMGIDSARFAELVRLAGNPPGPETLLDLWRRGSIDESDVNEGIRQGRIRTEWLSAIKSLRHVLLTPQTIASLVARNLLPENEGAAYVAKEGISGEDFKRLVNAAREVPPGGEILTMLNRGDITEDEARNALRRNGLHPDYVDSFLNLRFYVPTPPDVVRFGVREVFSPEFVNRYGLLEDIPTQAYEWAERAGLPPEIFRLYWAAHWALPSITAGYEMLHRRIITEQELKDLMRAQDIMPGWRDKLIKLSYNPLTRVDIRRMYRDGTINKRQVYEANLDIGYSPENAQLLAEWITQERTRAERDFTKGEVIALYQSRTMDRQTAESNLRAYGLGEDEVTMLLALADYRRDKARRTRAIGVVRGRFLARQITQLEASNRLDGMGIPADERDDLLDEWQWTLDESPKLLTETQMRAAFIRGIVDQATYEAHLQRLGFEKDAIQIMLKLYAPTPEAKSSPEKDLTRADILRFYRTDQWARDRAREALLRAGYSEDETTELLNDIDLRYKQEDE